MTAQTIVALSSVLGAVSFFVSGLFLGRGSRNREVEHGYGTNQVDDRQLSAPWSSLAQEERWSGDDEPVFEVGNPGHSAVSPPFPSQAAGYITTDDPLIETRSDDRAELEIWRLQQQAQHLQATLEQAESENRRLHGELAEMRRLRERRGKVWAEVNRLQQKEESLGRLREERQHLADKLHEVQHELHRLMPLRERLDVAEREREELVSRLQGVSGHMEELAQKRVENDRLRVELREAAELKRRIAELEEEIAALRAQKAGAGKGMTHFPRSRLAEALEVSIQPALNELAANGRYQAAVVSDDLGLAVAGFGEEIDTMAAMAAAYGDLGSRIEGTLSNEPVKLLGAKLRNNLFLCTVPLQSASERLVLTTLTVGGGPSRDEIRLLEDRLHPHRAPQVAYLGEGQPV